MFNNLISGESIEKSTTATDPPQSQYLYGTSASSHLTIGPTIGVDLSNRWALSVDLLYKRLGYDTADVLQTQPDEDDEYEYLSQTYESTRADSWEIPVLLRFYTRPSDNMTVAKPYINGGIAFRKVANITTSLETINADGYRDTDNTPAAPAHSLITGAVLGTGIRLRGNRHPVQADFEARFTRWFQRSFENDLIHSGLNQIECVMSVTF